MNTEHDMTLAGTVARLKASINWMREGIYANGVGCISVLDMEAMLPIVEAALATGPRPAPDSDHILFVLYEIGRFARGVKMGRAVHGLCPAGCGCLWRDNFDGTMSLGYNQRSCVTCEGLPFDKLIPLFASIAADGGTLVDKSADPHERSVDEIVDLQGDVVDAEFPGVPTIAECIAQLDTWAGHLEAAIDRQAHEKLGQHPNDDADDARDPLEQLP